MINQNNLDVFLLEWNKFEINERKTTLFSHSKDNKYFLKIELKENQNKNFNIQQEFVILKELKDKNCQTSPEPFILGSINKEDLQRLSKIDLSDFEKNNFHYIIQEYIPSSLEFTLSDILLTVLEQKSLGIFQGDIKPDNIRFDQQSKICFFIDYDQSVRLTNEIKSLNNLEFFNFLSEYDKSKYGIGNWLRHFNGRFTKDDVVFLLRNNSLKLEDVSILKTQKTTNSDSGFYHSIDHDVISLVGSRDISGRKQILERTTFKQNEKILDVGCNQGLLSFYLQEKGCDVTGIDIDPHIITAAKITSNIFNQKVNFKCLDLDKVDKLEEFDTVMLFSVFHHTINQIENGKKIANACNRIILEARLNENGSQPIGLNSTWVNVARWNFETIEELVRFCEFIFPGFTLHKNLGLGSKNRYILEFIKK